MNLCPAFGHWDGLCAQDISFEKEKRQLMWKVVIADDEKLICRLIEALVD